MALLVPWQEKEHGVNFIIDIEEPYKKKLVQATQQHEKLHVGLEAP